MTKYLLSRLLRGLLSIVIVVAIVMILIYTCLDRNSIFAQDPTFTRTSGNAKEQYMMRQWEKYGYVDYIPYSDWLGELLKAGELDKEHYTKVSNVKNNEKDDTAIFDEMEARFRSEMESQGYTVIRQKGTRKDKAIFYAYKDIPVISRLWDYITGIFDVDNINYVEEEFEETVENKGLEFTLYDPVYQDPENPTEKKFSPAIMGMGTQHRYLLYFDSQFPYIHQNLLNIKLGTSYSINKDVDVFDMLTNTQGSMEKSTVTYPTGLVEESADNLHSATYVSGSLANGTAVIKDRYVDNYTNVDTNKAGFSKIGYSFVIGIISVLISYTLAIPLGTIMALRKDKFLDKIGTFYIVFILAVPSLAYIFLFKAIGRSRGLPDTFNMEIASWKMYILPIISLALPSIAGLMKWLRRYMIDQMNSDYVKFARSGGLGEGEIFRKHILKNAIIPIVHGIPGSVLGALTGAIITERVYVVPGAGNMLTNAINKYDNGVIVGMTLFYALLSVVSIILGDLLMSLIDPRISFVTKKGGK